MKIETENFAGIPALIIGEKADRAFLFVHGKMGSKDEAVGFAEIACPMGYQIIGIDLPEHGERKLSEEKLLPWIAVPEIQRVYRLMQERWEHISLRATSIGAWMSMLALQNEPISEAMLVSPLVDMENLIKTMMTWAGVTETDLMRRGEIPTDFGETLSWEYLCWVRANPICWRAPTRILYADQDHLTPRFIMDKFTAENNGCLTVMEHGEHWFHTEEQLCFLRTWEQNALKEPCSIK